MYGSGASTRIALAILGVQSAGFALIYGIGKMHVNVLLESFERKISRWIFDIQ
jgi:hypothetical protein